MAEKLFSYADKQVMDEVGSGGGGGGGSSTLIIHENENRALDKTWKQIHDHMTSGGMAVIVMVDVPEAGNYDQVFSVGGVFRVVDGGVSVYVVATSTVTYTTNTENGYPVVG